MKTAFFAAALTAALTATSAEAAEIIQFGMEGKYLSLFDPSVGTLDQVIVEFTAKPQLGIIARTDGGGPTSVEVSYSLSAPLTSWVEVANGEQSGVLDVETVAEAFGKVTINLDELDGAIRFGTAEITGFATGTFEFDVVNFISTGQGGAVFLDSFNIFPTSSQFVVSSAADVDLITFSITNLPMIEFSKLTYVYTPAVPEPSTWAMMIGGFGLVGGAMRNARRTRSVLAV